MYSICTYCVSSVFSVSADFFFAWSRNCRWSGAFHSAFMSAKYSSPNSTSYSVNIFFFSFSFVYLFCFLVSEGIVGSAPLLLCRVQALFSYHHISSFWHTTLRFSYARTDAMTFFPIDKWISVKDDLSCGCSGCACRREWEREIERKISVRIHTNCVLLRLGAKMSSLASLRMNQLSNAIP